LNVYTHERSCNSATQAAMMADEKMRQDCELFLIDAQWHRDLSNYLFRIVETHLPKEPSEMLVFHPPAHDGASDSSEAKPTSQVRPGASQASRRMPTTAAATAKSLPYSVENTESKLEPISPPKQQRPPPPRLPKPQAEHRVQEEEEERPPVPSRPPAPPKPAPPP
jgi:hypothetical protein